MANTLSEHAAKQLLANFGVPVAREGLAADGDAAAALAAQIGYPVAAKLCGAGIAHKTERGLVRLHLADESALRAAAAGLLAQARPGDRAEGLLIAEMVPARLELIAGLVRDAQFGPCVLLGLGGILSEALADVVFAAAPLSRAEARAAIHRLRASHLITRPLRGDPACDMDAIADVLVRLGELAAARPDIASVDINPLRIRGGAPVAVDALVELAPTTAPPTTAPPAARVRAAPEDLRERYRPLFAPRGIAVAGVSAHPGKFGFVAFHNLLRFEYPGRVFPINREGAEVLGHKTLRSAAELPQNAAELVFVCTPHAANPELLRACHARGVRAAFIASGGYAEAGEEGVQRQRELAALANSLGMVLAGPNGQGVINTAQNMCAQIVAPFPPPGVISVASQSGNLVSSFLNYAVESGVGIAKAISAGNAAQTALADYLEFYGADPETRVVLAYLEGFDASAGSAGRRFAEAARFVSERKPLVLVRGGAAAEGRRAAASHTGSLASDDRIFDGVAQQTGALRAARVEDAFEWAASFATQPLPRGRRTVVLTTAGGWGVLAADACAQNGLDLIPLPADLRAQIDELVPPRWSRGNPVDLAGGETRDTVPEALDRIAAHPHVDAVIHLGIGIQAAQAQVFRSGRFYPEHGLERIAEFHQRQDRRYAAAAAAASARHAKPVLSASELVQSDRAYGNSGPRGLREEGRLCYPSAHRAVAALAALCRYANWHRTHAGG